METTIAAVSTAMSESGIGIVRISGPDSISIAEKIFRPANAGRQIKSSPSHTIHYGHIVDGDLVVDEILLMLMKAPHTYTGEDTIEIDCHGGIQPVRRVLETVLKNGAVPAGPGEFTKRAFLNGKMDLSQAEAVMDVITSKNEYALQSSEAQLRGALRDRIRDIRQSILHETAFIETALDDPEHFDLSGYPEKLKKIVETQISRLDELIHSASGGRIMKEGIRTVILGKPNAGKSSILNVLLGESRAIVTEIAGTTRDTLEEYLNIGDVTLRICDTAGIHEPGDIVEKIGIDKAKKEAAEADLILLVIDSSSGMDKNDEEIISLLDRQKVIVLYNKTDLESVVDYDAVCKRFPYPVIRISAKQNIGIRDLETKIREMFLKGDISFNDEVFISNIRHKKELENARDSLLLVINGIEACLPEDFLSIDLMNACTSLGNITGETTGEDLINEIFSKFCVGK